MIRMGRAALLVALGACPARVARAEDPPDPALTVVVTGTRTPESGARASYSDLGSAARDASTEAPAKRSGSAAVLRTVAATGG